LVICNDLTLAPLNPSRFFRVGQVWSSLIPFREVFFYLSSWVFFCLLGLSYRHTPKDWLVLWSISIGFVHLKMLKWLSISISFQPLGVIVHNADLYWKHKNLSIRSAKERKNLNVYLIKVYVLFLSCCK